MERLQWYAYRHVNDSVHIKRYSGDFGDIQEANESPFVARVVGPFSADSREEAERKAKELMP